MAKFLFACLLAAAAIYLVGSQPMDSSDLNRLQGQAEYQIDSLK